MTDFEIIIAIIVEPSFEPPTLNLFMESTLDFWSIFFGGGGEGGWRGTKRLWAPNVLHW